MRPAARGFFPLDERWGVGQSVYSPARVKQMVWLAGRLTYAEAVQAFERIGHAAIPATAIWRETQTHGERLRRYIQRQQEHLAVERVVLPPAGQDHHQRLGLSLDGGKMHIRGEGWKEFKLGTVYDVVLTPAWDADTQEEVDQVHGVNLAYRAVLGTVDEFAPALCAHSGENDQSFRLMAIT